MLLLELIFGVALAAAVLSDFKSRRIPNRLTVSLFLVGLLVRLVMGGPVAAGLGVLGAGVGFALLVGPFAGRWIGAGDVKLMMAAGAWLGPWGALLATLFGIALGGLLSAVMLSRGSQELRREVNATLETAMYTMSLPAAPGRPRTALVPQALPLAVATLGVLVYLGGFHV